MKLRKEWIIVPLACILFFAFINAINPACEWTDVLDVIGIDDGENYSALAVLAVALIAVVAILRTCRKAE